jgi:hypothetical protein
MAAASVAFIALPGGAGTLEELVESGLRLIGFTQARRISGCAGSTLRSWTSWRGRAGGF